MSSNPRIPFPQDIGSSFAEEFLLHPDYRVIAGFLLGWVLWSGLAYAGRSHFFQQLARLCWNSLRRANSAAVAGPDLEAQSPVNEKKSQWPLGALAQPRRVSNDISKMLKNMGRHVQVPPYRPDPQGMAKGWRKLAEIREDSPAMARWRARNHRAWPDGAGRLGTDCHLWRGILTVATV
ncbi:hypothetical protein BD309DRAFT_20235 [Dichomitus squalens]|nr:hypothetical protein BD309DRAFT_20235 [Dichomitus squalens]